MKSIVALMIAVILLVGSALLSGCAQQTTPAAPAPSTSSAPKADSSAAPRADTAAPKADAAPKAAAPAVPKTDSAAAPKAAAPAASQDGPKRGQTLRIAIASEAPSYDSHSDTTMRIHAHGAAVFNGLVRTDPLKEEVSVQNMIGDLAEKWEISPDNLTYTFYLRKGVKFHDGKPFTSADVKYSLDKYRDPKRGAFAQNVAAIDSIDVVDDHTVKIRLKYVDPEYIVFLSSPYASIYPVHKKDVNPRSTDFLVGTGPFVFKQLVPGKMSVYERNPDYFVPGLPYLDKYEVYYLSRTAMGDAFTSGQLSFAGSFRELFGTDPAMRENLYKNVPEMKVGAKAVGSTRSVFFSFTRNGAWRDVNVRKAMAMVIDYDEALMAGIGPLWKQLGYETYAGLVPYYVKEALPKDEVTKLFGTDKPLADRIVAAKQLMKDAGYANGFKAEMLMRKGESALESYALYAMDMWKKHLNVDVALSPLDQTILYSRRDKGDFDMVMDSTGSMTGSLIGEFLPIFLTGEIRNYGKWANAQYDDLVKQLPKVTDQQKKTDLARQAQRLLLADVPLIVITQQADASAWRPDLRIGWPNPLQGMVQQPLKTAYSSLDRMWFAETPDAARWTKVR